MITPAYPLNLTSHLARGGSVTPSGVDTWHLEIPPGPKGRYRLAQLDDYRSLNRNSFPWSPPLTLSLHARASAEDIAGTWGFGLWNDPFSLSLGVRGGSRRFPALPIAAWFFFASPQNYLSFRDDLPANGFLTAVFRSPHVPPPALALGAAGLPLLAWSVTARWARRIARRLINEDAAQLDVDVTRWHQYEMTLRADQITYLVDGKTRFETPIVPNSPMGVVIWIDNQYAAFSPDGGLSYGTLSTKSYSWMEIKELNISTP